MGAHSGVIKDKLNHVAHILHSGNALADYEVRCCTLKRKAGGRTEVRASVNGPLTWLSILGCCMSFTLGGLSIWQDDGMSLLATILLSLLSTIIGIGSKWTLELPTRKTNRKVPPGDVVICYPHGAFMVIKCEEPIARELYWAPEKCNYMVSENVYRLVALTGTILLMFGVIFLANASINLQIAYAVSYIIINAAYWVVAALPQKLHWELSAFEEEPELYEDRRDFGNPNPNFTEALWRAIAISRTTHWVRIADAAPKHRAWDMWLAQAEREVRNYNYDDNAKDGRGLLLLPDWNFQNALTECMGAAEAERLRA